jgi:mRNA interferase RelE/StbE
MEYTLIYHPDVKKKDLPFIPVNIRARIKKAIEDRLLNDPVKFGLPLRRSLKSYKKLRIGDYRVIYRLKAENILILKIGHRKEVYSEIAKRTVFKN